MTYQDFTAYTEQDTENKLDIISNYKASWSSYTRNTNSYLYKDFGTGYFGDFNIEFEYNFVNHTNNYGRAAFLILTNTISGLQYYPTPNDGEGITIEQTYDFGTVTRIRYASGSENIPDSIDTLNDALSEDTLYDGKIWRSGSTVGMYVFNHDTEEVFSDQMAISCQADASPEDYTKFRYLMVGVSDDDDDTGEKYISGYIQNLEIIKAGGLPSPTISNYSDGCITSGVTTATLTGEVTESSGMCYIYCSSATDTEYNISTNCGVISSNLNDGYFSGSLYNLNQGGTYYYKCYITSQGADGNGWGKGDSWSDSATEFTIKAPYLDSTSESDITIGTAKLTVYPSGSGTVWVCYDDSSDQGADFGGWDVSSNLGYKPLYTSISEIVSPLMNNTTYYYRFYMSSQDGKWESWSDADSFLTEELTIAASTDDINIGQATLNGQVTNGSGTVYLCYGTLDGGEETPSDWQNSDNKGYTAEGITRSSIPSDLINNTSYYYSAYVTSQGHGDKWNDSNFSTLNLTISNPGAISITNTTATLKGNISIGSGHAWFWWGDEDGGADRVGWDYSSNNQLNDGYYTSGLTGLIAETTYYYRCYVSSLGHGDEWSELADFTTGVNPIDKENDLQIYYDDFSEAHLINCWCSRWDVQNYSLVVETWMNKSNLNTLRNNITPGAAGELYTILGRPRYYDSTWQAGNTLKFSPNQAYQLSNMRKDTLAFVKNITDTPIDGASGWLNVKLECLISGTGGL